MKKVLFAVALSGALVACQKDEPAPIGPNGSSGNVDPQDLTSFLVADDTWRISEFMEDNANETDDFNGYVFDFQEGGKVAAIRNDERVEGSFNVFTDDGRTEMRMNFPVTGNFSELTDDWYYISQTSSQVRFEDDGDVLVFSSSK